MGEPLETKIKKLQQFYWSDADPEGRAFVSLADALRRKGDFLEALRLLRDGLRRHPGLSSGHVVRGRVYVDQGDPSDAESAFRSALELDPRNVEALHGLAGALREQGEIGEALGILRRLAPLYPLNEDLPRQVSELEKALEAQSSRAGSGEGAAEARRPPVWEDPEAVAEELNWDAAALQDDESREEQEAATGVPGTPPGALSGLSARPPGREDALVTRTMGDIFLRQGLLDEAEDVFRQLLERHPEEQEIRDKMAEVEARRRGEWEADDGPEGGTAATRGRAPSGRWVVPIQHLLIEEILPIEDLAPGSIVPIQGLAPEVTVPVEALAPEAIVPVEALAPESSPEDSTLDAFEIWLDDLP